MQHVHQGVGQGAPEVAQLGRQAGEADPGLGREGQAVVRGVGGEERVEGVRQGDHLGGVDALHRLGQAALGVRAGAGVGHQRAGAAAQQGQVAGADPPAGAGQEADQGGVGGGVVEDLADRHQVGDLGEVEQPGQAHDLDGQLAPDQGGLDLGEVRGRAAQDGDVARARAGAHQVGEAVREPVQLLGVGGQQGAAHHAVTLGARGGAQGLHARVALAQGGGEGVGEVEEAAAAAAVLAEGVAAGRAAVGVGEVGGEVVEVGHGRATPAVDGLAGVADGGHRVARAAAEEAGQEDALGDRGVLVLVEEDDRELLAEDAADLGAGAGELGAQGDLVAEVEEVAAVLLAAVRLDQAEQLQAGAGGVGHLAQVGVGEPGAFEGGQQLAVVGAQPGGGDEVLGQLAVEGEEVGDQVGEGAGERGVRARGGGQDAGGELEAGGVGEEAGGGLEADAQAVFLQEAAGEGVVGGDLGLAARGGVVLRLAGGDAGLPQGPAHALGQLAGRLVGEGQAEDLLGGDLSGADEPDHARGHDGGLAGPGAGHDDLRGERRGDAGRLLRGEGDAEELLELLGVGQARGHTGNASGGH